MEMKINDTKPEEYARLMIRCGNKRYRAEAITGALRNSLFTAGIYDEDQLIAFGRVTGDGFINYIVCDIMVDPEYTGYKFDAMILQEVDDLLRATATKDRHVYVLAERPLDDLCLRYGYKYLDPDYMVIMNK